MEVSCIKCGTTSSVVVDVEDGGLSCSQCNESFTVEDVEAVLAGWTAVLPWVKAHPARLAAAAEARGPADDPAISRLTKAVREGR